MSADEIAREARNLAVEHRQHPRAITSREVAALCDAVCGLANVVAVLVGRVDELEARPKAGRPPGSLNRPK